MVRTVVHITGEGVVQKWTQEGLQIIFLCFDKGQEYRRRMCRMSQPWTKDEVGENVDLSSQANQFSRYKWPELPARVFSDSVDR